jgi:hypothetical protein
LPRSHLLRRVDARLGWRRRRDLRDPCPQRLSGGSNRCWPARFGVLRRHGTSDPARRVPRLAAWRGTPPDRVVHLDSGATLADQQHQWIHVNAERRDVDATRRLGKRERS